MGTTLKRRLAALVPDGEVAPRAAIIGVSPDDDGRPQADIPVAVVVQGDEVIWCAPAEFQRPFQIMFGRSQQPLPDAGRAELVQVVAECGSAASPDPLTNSAPVLASAPLQVVRMRINRNAVPGRYPYLLYTDADGSVDPDRPPPDLRGQVLVVMRGPVVDDGDGPVPVN